MTPFKSLALAMFKGFLRDKTAIFFMLLFPLMFLVIFGLLLGNSGPDKTKIAVVGDGPIISALGQTGALDLQRFADQQAAEQKVEDGDLPAMVAEWGGDVVLRYAASDQVQAGTVVGIVSGVADKVNLGVTGKPPTYTLRPQSVEDSSLKPIQHLTPGILCRGVAISAVFGSALTLLSWRKKQVLRRIQLAPVSAGTVLTWRVLVSVGTAVLQAVVFIAVALTPAFGLKLSGQWWLASPLLVLGTVAFFAIGMLVGAFCKSEESASGAANVIVLPMAFLGGTFFPLERAPRWLQAVSQVFPLRHLNDGMLDVLVRGKGVEALIVPSVVLIGFTLVIGFVAARVFRWED
jgi:ABC-2 type transport system permease protein